MHEAVLEDVLSYDRSTLSLRGQRHVLRLHVGSEAGILFRRNIRSLQITLAANANLILAKNLDSSASLLKLGDDRAEMRRIAVGNAQIAATNRTGNEKSPSLDPIRINPMPRHAHLQHTKHESLKC